MSGKDNSAGVFHLVLTADFAFAASLGCQTKDRRHTVDAQQRPQRSQPAIQQAASQGKAAAAAKHHVDCVALSKLDLLLSVVCVKEHQQLEQDAKELAEKINSIVGRAKHLASNHFNSQKILQETDTYLSL